MGKENKYKVSIKVVIENDKILRRSRSRDSRAHAGSAKNVRSRFFISANMV